MPVIGVEMRKLSTAPLLAPCFCKLVAKGITPQEHTGIGMPKMVAFITDAVSSLPRCFFIHKGVRAQLLTFMNNNWYLAVETEDNEFRFLRIAFIKEVHYSQKITYQRKVLEKYASFFQKIQNPFTLPKDFQIAYLRASKKVAKYFLPDKKPFFPSQKFVSQNEDGSVEFSVKYTNSMEILPFVKQWLPDIEIVSPQELRKELMKDLQIALKKYSISDSF